jgi:hypothetical protein
MKANLTPLHPAPASALERGHERDRSSAGSSAGTAGFIDLFDPFGVLRAATQAFVMSARPPFVAKGTVPKGGIPAQPPIEPAEVHSLARPKAKTSAEQKRRRSKLMAEIDRCTRTANTPAARQRAIVKAIRAGERWGGVELERRCGGFLSLCNRAAHTAHHAVAGDLMGLSWPFLVVESRDLLYPQLRANLPGKFDEAIRMLAEHAFAAPPPVSRPRTKNELTTFLASLECAESGGWADAFRGSLIAVAQFVAERIGASAEERAAAGRRYLEHHLLQGRGPYAVLEGRQGTEELSRIRDRSLREWPAALAVEARRLLASCPDADPSVRAHWSMMARAD